MSNTTKTAKSIIVTFVTQTGNEMVETFSYTPHENGFVPATSYKTRAMALGWTVKSVETCY